MTHAPADELPRPTHAATTHAATTHSATTHSATIARADPPKHSFTQTAIVHHLHNEWRHLSIRAGELRRVHSWNLPGGDVGSLDEVLDRAGFRRVGTSVATGAADARVSGGDPDGARSDEFLLHLVRLARTDRLAGRIVLQRILPALCALARRHASAWNRRSELVDELVANSWQVIRNYPVERRPRRVASNLVRDIGFQTIVRPQRRLAATAELATAPHNLPDVPRSSGPPTVEPLHELVDLVRDARRVGAISDGDVELICQLINHRRPENVAELLDVTPRTVRNHRDAVVHRLRRAALAAA